MWGGARLNSSMIVRISELVSTAPFAAIVGLARLAVLERATNVGGEHTPAEALVLPLGKEDRRLYVLFGSAVVLTH